METMQPNDVQAEQAVLGAILIDNTSLDRLTLQTQDFHDARHRDVFKAMTKLRSAGKGIDEVTLYNDGAAAGAYLAELRDASPSAANIADHAAIVHEKAVKRSLLAQIEVLSKHAQNGVSIGSLREAWTEAGELLTEQEPEEVTLFSMADLLSEPDEEQPWTVDKLLPAGGLSLINGKPGAGKTTFVRDFALSVAQGRSWLGRSVRPGPVVYLALEEQKRQVKQHMVKMGATADDPIHFHIEPMRDPIKTLTRYIEQYKPALVVIDPVARFLQVPDLNDYARVSAALDPLIHLAHSTGTHICLIHHARKGEAGVDSYLGSTALSGSVDTNLLLDVDVGGQRTLSVIKQRGDGDVLEPTIIALDPETGRCEAQGTRDEAKQHDIGAELIRYLADHPEPIKQSELLMAVKGRKTEKHKVLIRLVDVGKVQRKMEGKSFICWLPSSSSTRIREYPGLSDTPKDAGVPVSHPLRGDTGTPSGEGVWLGSENGELIEVKPEVSAKLESERQQRFPIHHQVDAGASGVQFSDSADS